MNVTRSGSTATLLAAALCAAFANPCSAQPESPANPGPAADAAGSGSAPAAAAPTRRNTAYFVGGAAAGLPLGVGVDIVGREGAVVGKVVRGKPYSADSITESTQVLADGNRITHTSHARVYRDAQGRSRREQTLAPVGPASPDTPATLITIDDPVAGVSYVLDASTKTAQELKPFVLNGKPSPSAPAAGGGPFVLSGTLSRSTPAAGGAETAVAPRVVIRSFASHKPAPGEAGGAGPETLPGLLPPLNAQFSVRAFDRAAPDPSQVSESTEDLGDEVLQGVLAHGTRQTTTIAAGAIGNEMPISIVSERWYSTELEAVILERNSDPRFGETTYRLVDVVKGDPPADLFTVPDDYRVRTGAGPDTVVFGPEGGGKPVVIFRSQQGLVQHEETQGTGSSAGGANP